MDNILFLARSSRFRVSPSAFAYYFHKQMMKRE